MTIATNPASNGAAIVPNDDTVLPETRALYIGTSGDLKVVMVGGSTVTFVGISGIVPIRVTKIYATDTSASDIVGLY